MVTAGNLKNTLDALAQLRRFDPDIVVLCDGAPVTGFKVSEHETDTGTKLLVLNLTVKPA